jgi:hypothetical protein
LGACGKKKKKGRALACGVSGLAVHVTGLPSLYGGSSQSARPARGIV